MFILFQLNSEYLKCIKNKSCEDCFQGFTSSATNFSVCKRFSFKNQENLDYTVLSRGGDGKGTVEYKVNKQEVFNGPHHEKTCLCHMRTTKVQVSLHICTVWSAPLLFAAWIV